MKQFQATRFIILAIAILFIGSYHTMEMNNANEPTREQQGFYGPGY